MTVDLPPLPCPSWCVADHDADRRRLGARMREHERAAVDLALGKGRTIKVCARRVDSLAGSAEAPYTPHWVPGDTVIAVETGPSSWFLVRSSFEACALADVLASDLADVVLQAADDLWPGERR